jgi:hypothetical protein
MEELSLHGTLTEAINNALTNNKNGTTDVLTALLQQLMAVVIKQTQ